MTHWMRHSLLVLSLLTACGPSQQPPQVDAEGCEHLREGPSVPVTASATASNAPAIDDDHQRYDVALTDVPGGKGGRVRFAPAAAGDYVLYLGAEVPLKVLDSAEQGLPFESSATTSEGCSEIRGRHVVSLSVGTYQLSFGPTSASSVSVVVEPEEH